MFVGTEFGVFFTIDGGGNWVKLSGGAPTIAFRDLVIQTRENDLVGATFGRGFWILDDYSALRDVSEDQLQQGSMLFPVKDAWWYLPKLTLGDFEPGGKSSQGDAFYVAPNPPFGAVFTYYLRDGLKTGQEQRREAEKKLEKAGDDTPYPGWDALRREEIEEPPAIILTVRDDAGQVVRYIEGPLEAGFHRVAWDLRYAQSAPWTPEPAEPDYIRIPGPLAAPGTYTVSLASRVDGQLTELGSPQTFEVTPLRQRGLAGASPEEMTAFALRLDNLNREIKGAGAGIEALLTETAAIRETLLRSRAPDDLRVRSRGIELELLELQQRLEGNETRSLYSEEGPVSIERRLEVAVLGTFRSTYGPTPTHQRSLEIADREFAEVKERLTRIGDTDLPALRRDLDAAGVPWTPGRTVQGPD